MRGVYRGLLGVSLIAHGLGSTVLPMRGADAVAPGVWSPVVAAMYITAIVGFVASGLGVLGVRPLKPVASWAAVVAAIAGLAAAVPLGDGTLWPGIALNVVLPVITTVWMATAARTVVYRHTQWRWATDAVGLAFLGWIAASALLWPWHRGWGTEPTEWVMALPGDRTPRAPAMEILHGVTIEAPPSEVWQWLVQLGQDRAGFYSYESLERLFGVHIQNVTEIRPEWQMRAAGDFVPATQSGYLAGVLGDRPGWAVDAVEPGRVLLLQNWGAFVLQPAGEGRTRFLIRSTISHERIPAWAAALNLTAFELPHFIMQRRMMLNIKALSERS